MPNLFIVSAIVAHLLVYWPVAQRERRNTSVSDEAIEEIVMKRKESAKVRDVTDYSQVSIQLGYGLVEMVDDDLVDH